MRPYASRFPGYSCITPGGRTESPSVHCVCMENMRTCKAVFDVFLHMPQAKWTWVSTENRCGFLMVSLLFTYPHQLVVKSILNFVHKIGICHRLSISEGKGKNNFKLVWRHRGLKLPMPLTGGCRKPYFERFLNSTLNIFFINCSTDINPTTYLGLNMGPPSFTLKKKLASLKFLIF